MTLRSSLCSTMSRGCARALVRRRASVFRGDTPLRQVPYVALRSEVGSGQTSGRRRWPWTVLDSFLWLIGAPSLAAAALIVFASGRSSEPTFSYVNGILLYLTLAAAFASWALASWRTGSNDATRVPWPSPTPPSATTTFAGRGA